jgi:hypothetical protein
VCRRLGFVVKDRIGDIDVHGGPAPCYAANVSCPLS